jgi:DNA-binding XRE family transcriptional regulator
MPRRKHVAPTPRFDPDMFGEKLAPDELQDWRKIRGLQQDDLATMLGVTQAAVSYWESGSYPIPAWLALALETVDRRLGRFTPVPVTISRAAMKVAGQQTERSA